jgi:hypothetical protein
MIVGICGLAGSGKDTAADFLVKNEGFVKIAFADPLKRICRDVYDFTDLQLWGPSEERNKPDTRYPREHGPYSGDKCMCCGIEPYKQREAGGELPQCYLTPRFALQLLGTEWGRTCYPNTWADLAIRTARKVLYQSGILRSVFFNYDARVGLTTSSTPLGPKPRGVVISDVRFVNEIVAINGASGFVYQTTRGFGLEGAAGQHKSEVEMRSIPQDLFKGQIDNKDWTLEELEFHMNWLANHHLKEMTT